MNSTLYLKPCKYKAHLASLPFDEVAKNEVLVTREGECCPECEPSQAICNTIEPIRYHGDIWNTSTCDYCTCNNGNVQCYTAMCENIVCFKEEVLVHKSDTCCPQCIIPPSCQFAGQIYQDGERWTSDDCTICVCESGIIRCFTKHCPTCDNNMKSIALPGDCCTCKKGWYT
ncbi:Extracellular matrix protein fras1 [Mactra antiquata]